MKIARKQVLILLIALFYILLLMVWIFRKEVDPFALVAPGAIVAGTVAGWYVFRSRMNLLYYVGIYALTILLFYIERMGGDAVFMGGHVVKFILTGMLIAFSMRSKKLSLWIFSSMIIGVEVGLDFPELSLELKRFGDIFIRLIKTLVAPLLFSTLVVGIAGHSNLKQVGRIGLKSIIYFEVVTSFALLLGLAAINLTQAGKGIQQVEVSEKMKEKSMDLLTQLEKPKDHFVDIFPENFAKAIVENQVLQIVVFSLIFAVALSLVQNLKHKETMLNWMESLSEVMFKFTDIVMYIAPLAVFGSIAYTVANSGTDVLANLMKLVVTLYVTLVVFILVVLLPVALVSKVPLKGFIKAVTEPFSVAFATASSEAALPKALENMEKFGVSRKIVGFVIPTGYSFNLDGTTLYLSMATVFVAQMSGIDLTIGQQISICLTLMLTSKGVAGVRGASFVILTTTLTDYRHLGISVEKAGIILGIDALMDMGRTSVNVLGNCLASAVIARSEGELLTEKNNE
ncbi:cation:dicarboxylate symporter family transporter [Fluviicola sp.]|uniref:dicarboxylate/amino acid:cation symporter n=1 Tax=Fluviicola sp. TaxID=1917219 RepID=UPI00281DB754|nr:cation:dicarboxylase symporter family transporter [Fluviicola sp.]MDR0802803.1 cation:dicarboxylase symporter family transporter [Fluviicola sp.]